MADQVSPLGGLSAGMAQSIQSTVVPSQSRPAQNRPADPNSKAANGSKAEGDRGKSVSKETLEEAAKAVEDYLQQSYPDLQFSVDKDTGDYCIKVVDPKSQEVIRQVPSEEALAMARRLQTLGSKDTSGVLIDSEG